MIDLDPIKTRLAAVPPMRPYATARGGVVLLNGPFELPEAHAAVAFVEHAPDDIAALIAEVERLRNTLVAMYKGGESLPSSVFFEVAEWCAAQESRDA